MSTTFRAILTTVFAATLVASAACSFQLPRVHQVTIQQGNVITQEMIDQLKPGMTREQVAFIMGEPVVRNTFDENRWDYVYTIDIPRAFKSQLLVSLFFTNDLLSLITGDLAPTSATSAETAQDP